MQFTANIHFISQYQILFLTHIPICMHPLNMFTHTQTAHTHTGILVPQLNFLKACSPIQFTSHLFHYAYTCTYTHPHQHIHVHPHTLLSPSWKEEESMDHPTRTTWGSISWWSSPKSAGRCSKMCTS